MEQMVEQGYEISATVGNFGIMNCLCGSGPDSKNQGFGGIDTILEPVMSVEVEISVSLLLGYRGDSKGTPESP